MGRLDEENDDADFVEWRASQFSGSELPSSSKSNLSRGEGNDPASKSPRSSRRLFRDESADDPVMGLED